MRYGCLIAAVFLFTAANGWGAMAAKADGSWAEMDIKTVASGPRPEYPYEARRAWITGTGIVELEIDSKTGAVTSVRMFESTGHALLDDAATEAFRQWRFKPGTTRRLRTPITFTVTNGRPITQYKVQAKPMDDVLAGFLGKGTVVRGPIPDYPKSPRWTNKQGDGVYELHVRKDGKVEDVRILKSSGDGAFDAVTVKTLRKWQLRRGPLILELPLRFTLTPKSYSVDIPRKR